MVTTLEPLGANSAALTAPITFNAAVPPTKIPSSIKRYSMTIVSESGIKKASSASAMSWATY